jgi:hypothetical protein
MFRLLSFAAAGLVVAAGAGEARAQYFHGHVHYHNGHYHLHGHWHYPSYYPAYPANYGSTWYQPAYGYPSVVVSPPTISYPNPVADPGVIVPANTPASAPALKPNPLPQPNALPPYAGPGVTLRLPAEFPNPVHVRIGNRDVELKPGTEVTLKDRASYVVEFDRGGDFGAARHELSEGVYKMTVGNTGWEVLLDTTPGKGLRLNPLPPPAKGR